MHPQASVENHPSPRHSEKVDGPPDDSLRSLRRQLLRLVPEFYLAGGDQRIQRNMYQDMTRFILTSKHAGLEETRRKFELVWGEVTLKGLEAVATWWGGGLFLLLDLF